MFRDFKKYEIFPDGRIWSYVRNKWLKPYQHPSGYYYIVLSDNDNNVKNYLYHRIVYEAVTGQPIPEELDVNHINEDKSDNRFENLNLMTRQENINHGTRNERARKSKINHPMRSKQVAQYDKDGNLIQVWISTMEVQRQLGYSQGNISKCCQGKLKTYKGFIWKYTTENPS